MYAPGKPRTKCKSCYSREQAVKVRDRYWADPKAYKAKQKAAEAKRRAAGWKPAPRLRFESYFEKKKISGVRRRTRVKRAAFEAYGGAACACCRESNLAFLTLDHVAGNGNVLRRMGEPSGEKLYTRLAKEGYPPGYQVLCMNCNWARRLSGVCPHQNGA